MAMCRSGQAFLVAVLALAPFGARAEEAPFARRADIRLTLRDASTVETAETREIVLRTAEAVRSLGQARIYVNENFYEMTIVAAYTQKADGRRVPVPKDKIIVSVEADAAVNGTFRADVKGRTIVFPDVSPGDTVHWETVMKARGPSAIAGISRSYFVAPVDRYESYVVSLSAPKAVAVQAVVEGFGTVTEEKGDRRITRWTATPPAYQPEESGSVAAFDRSPHLVLSTVKDWHVIGGNFYTHAAPKAQPTAKVKALAAEITKGKTDRRAQAEAIFRWVQQSVRYYNIVLGVGGWVPHDADTILTNRFGDCKDYATLTKALLAAKGIEADFVLTNLSAIYHRYDVVSATWTDHAILYVPEFDRFIDPTSPYATFNTPPPAEAGKYALRVRKASTELVRIPVPRAEDNRYDIAADATLDADGGIVGTSTIRSSGNTAFRLRAALARAEGTGTEAAVEQAFTSAGWRGRGRVESRAELGEDYEVKTSFTLETGLLKNATASTVVPYGPRLIAPALNLLETYANRAGKAPVMCWPESQRIVLSLRLPEGVRVTNLPKDKTIDDERVSYAARYSVTDGVLHVERTLTLRLAEPVCSRELVDTLKPVISEAMKDVGFRPQLRKAG
jgi:transglutaminase-like putative cysteine protease